MAKGLSALTALVALVASMGAGLSNPAEAAVGAPLAPHGAALRPQVTEVYWVWRHHHRIWVPDHHHHD